MKAKENFIEIAQQIKVNRKPISSLIQHCFLFVLANQEGAQPQFQTLQSDPLLGHAKEAMNAYSRISNNAVIQYNSRPDVRSSLTEGNISVQPKTNGKASTKHWVFESFYLNKHQSSGKASSSKSDQAQRNQEKKIQQIVPLPTITKSSVQFDEYLIKLTAEKFKFCLVGKFPESRPSLEQIRRWASEKWMLEGQCTITLLNHSHIFIRLHNKNDMIHVWGHSRWSVNGHLMKIFKWSPTFRPSEEEPSVAAVWILLPSLPVVYFEKDLLYRVVSPIGEFLCMDEPTKELTRTHFARACVMVDLLKELPDKLWVGVGRGGFPQDVSYEKLPLYCSCCLQYGHSTRSCKLNTIPGTSGESSQLASDSSVENSHSEITCLPPSGLFPEKDPSCRTSFEAGPAATHNTNKSSVEREPNSIPSELKRTTIGRDCVSILSEHPKDLPYADADADKAIPNEVDGERIAAALGKNKVSKKFGPGARCLCSIFFWRKNRKQKQALEVMSDSSTDDLKLEKQSHIKKLRIEERKQSCQTLTLCKSVPDKIRSTSILHSYKYKEIVQMTASFSEMIGKGGSSSVYKGMLPDQRTVAVKVYAKEIPKGDYWFLNEIQIAGAASHKNILKLFGFCCEKSKKALVLEYAPNRSLDKHIHSEDPSNCSFASEQQFQIAVGMAEGINYMHSVCNTLHGDIKPGNILLDENLRPKICDFGLATRMETESSFTLSTMRGTVGYIAPELYNLKVSCKLDVYGYGVTLLEMLTRMRPLGAENIMEFAHNRLKQESDVEVEGEEETARMLMKVGLWCTQEKPEDRPSMTQVLGMLQGRTGFIYGIQMPPTPSRFRDLARIDVESEWYSSHFGSVGSLGSLILGRA